ncbi:MAG: cbb3-type cytochrome oxidase assembly protein CcoS [Alphaproteobacteria bacterium]|jgi:cbb3-type cytochrome oxidase maturation protein|nr:cbb3-type cytochrome oxidase assembly protein CcoS [Alphaproteobacteria bacterium]
MDAMIYLIPATIFMGVVGLGAFLWTMRSGQYDDLEGAAERILIDDEDDAPAVKSSRAD